MAACVCKNLPNFLNLTLKSILDRQQCVHFRKSLHPTEPVLPADHVPGHRDDLHPAQQVDQLLVETRLPFRIKVKVCHFLKLFYNNPLAVTPWTLTIRKSQLAQLFALAVVFLPCKGVNNYY